MSNRDAGLNNQMLVRRELEDLLVRWHIWCQSSPVGRGWHRKALVCGDFRVSRQYDDVNGALDGDLEHSTMETVDFEVSELPHPHRALVHVYAKKLHGGDSGGLEHPAIELLTNRLTRAGVL